MDRSRGMEGNRICEVDLSSSGLICLGMDTSYIYSFRH